MEQATSDHYLSLLNERTQLRGDIRAAADTGDHTEVRRLLQRAHDLELDFFGYRYTEVRHARAQRGRLGGFNPDLETVEHKLNELLARAGEPTPRDMWQHRG